MYRKLFGTLAVATVLCVSAVMADEMKGTVKKVDVDAKKITFVQNGKEKTLEVADNCKFPTVGKDKTPGTLKSFAASVEKSKDKGVSVTITTDKENKKVIEIKRERMVRPTDKPKPPQD